jgi:beta-glucosidase
VSQSNYCKVSRRLKLWPPAVLALLMYVAVPAAWSADQPSATVVTGDARVDKLLHAMTLEEKIAMMHGGDEDPATYQGQAGYLPGVPRLGIPALRLADGPPGVLTRVSSTALTATMGVAATFSRDDARQNGMVIARDARALGMDVVLQPFINMDRDLTFERGYNTFGEDPLLTGQIAAAEIEGVQSQGIMAQAKHYIGYDGGNNVFIGDQALHEIYAAPFADAVRAGVSSIMCSYNKINGTYACGNPDTLIQVLRDQIGFKGFVTSDWGADHDIDFFGKGLDLEMPGPLTKNMDDEIRRDVQSGRMSEATIDRAVGRILVQMDRFGFLDDKQKHSITPIDSAADAPVVLKTAEDAAVLLKNDQSTLPLTKDDLHSLAVIGPGAGQIMAIGIPDEKAVGILSREVSPLDALKRATADDPEAQITYAVADDLTGSPIPARFLSHNGMLGLERKASSGKVEQADSQINFAHSSDDALPANSTYSWDGTLTIPTAGSYLLCLQNLGSYASLTLDGKKLASNQQMVNHGNLTQAGQDGVLPTTDGLDNLRVRIPLTAGAHTLHVTVEPDSSNNPTQIRLNWVTPEQRKANHDAAVATARQARVAIVFAWGADDPVFHLADEQDQLIADIAAVNPNTVVVLNVSQPVAMPWLAQVKSVLNMWYPGQEGGQATADLLMGNADPGGRLPFTWPQRLDQGVANDPKHPVRISRAKGDEKTVYSEGIFIGYRWYDEQKLEPLFPFGYGLSYTRFEYSGLKSGRSPDGGLDVRFTLRNTGNQAGDEVPQVYLNAPQDEPAGAQFAVRALAGFDRVHLDAGQSQAVTLQVPRRSLEYWSTASHRWMLAEGLRKVCVGDSSRNLALAGIVDIKR